MINHLIAIVAYIKRWCKDINDLKTLIEVKIIVAGYKIR